MTIVVGGSLLRSVVGINWIMDVVDGFGLLGVVGDPSSCFIDAVLVFGVKSNCGRLQVVPLRWKFGLDISCSNILFGGDM